MVKNFSHRGLGKYYPENTLLAFEKAIEIGIDGIEFDVQLTKDKKVVIIHDETIDRTSNGSGYVGDYTYDELLEYNFSKEFDYKFGHVKIPLLSEYFELVKDMDIISNIELKNSIVEYEGLEKAVYDLIIEYDVKDKVIISSFNHESLLKVKEIDSSITCGALVDCCLINPREYLRQYNIEAYHPMGYGLKSDTVDKLKKDGISVNVWLGKPKIDYNKLLEMDIDVLISDDIDIVKEILETNKNK